MPINYYFLGLKNSFNFKGYTSRKEFGYFFLFDILILLFVTFIYAIFDDTTLCFIWELSLDCL